MRFFLIAVAYQFERDVLHPCGWPAPEGDLSQWAKNVEDLIPAFTERLSQSGVGMFIAEDRDISVVVELDEIRSPPQQHRKAVGQ